MVKIVRSIKGKVLCALAVAVGVGLSVAPISMPTAHAAASNPYSAEGVCNNEAPGSGYSVQRWHKLKGATVYQLYNGTYNCAVTIKTASVGKPTLTMAGIKVEGKGWNINSGEFKYYAGAVWYDGKGKCVWYTGYHGGEGYTSQKGNCG